MTHGAMALLPNGFRFRFIPRKVPGLSAHWLRRREGGGQPQSRAMAYDPGCPLPLCRRFQYFLFCPFVFVAQSAGYIRPLPLLLPPPSSPPPSPPPPPPALPRPPPQPPAADLSSLVAEDPPPPTRSLPPLPPPGNFAFRCFFFFLPSPAPPTPPLPPLPPWFQQGRILNLPTLPEW